MATRWGSARWSQDVWSTTYVIEGQGANFAVARRIAADTGTYQIAGQPAGLQAGYIFGASPGAVAIGGQPAFFQVSRILTAGVASYAISGKAANLVSGRNLIASPGSLSIAGQDANLSSTRSFIAEAGSFAIDGKDALLNYAYNGSFVLAAFPGAYVIEGQDTAVSFSVRLTGAPGSLTITGQNAALIPTLIDEPDLDGVIEVIRQPSRPFERKPNLVREAIERASRKFDPPEPIKPEPVTEQEQPRAPEWTPPPVLPLGELQNIDVALQALGNVVDALALQHLREEAEQAALLEAMTLAEEEARQRMQDEDDALVALLLAA